MQELFRMINSKMNEGKQLKLVVWDQNNIKNILKIEEIENWEYWQNRCQIISN